MRTREAFRHNRTVRRNELAAINALGESVYRFSFYDLKETASAIREEQERRGSRRRDVYCSSPRVGTNLVREVFDDLRRISSRTGTQPRKAALSLARDLVLPIAGISLGEGGAVRGRIIGKKQDACMDAEPFFVKCIKQIMGESDDPHEVISGYHDPEGKPLALRKSEDVSTALTLQPISVRGVPVIPAGTIVSIGKEMNDRQTGECETDFGKLKSYMVRDRIAVGPIRLSPYAYDDVMDRSLFAIDENGDLKYDRIRARIVEPYTLEDYRLASARLLELCGVN